MSRATINGISMQYELHGPQHAEQVVLAHGAARDLSDWSDQVAEFARDYRLLTMDLRGHGGSEAPTDRTAYAIVQMANDVQALAAHVGFGHYHVVGHSMGGCIVQEIALQNSRCLHSLTLLCTLQQLSFRDNEIMREKVLPARFRIAEEQGMAAVVSTLPVEADPPHMPAGRRDLLRARVGEMSVDAYLGMWQGLLQWEGTQERAKDIGVPTLVISGELDSLTLEPSKSLASQIPEARLEIISEAAHDPQFERPELFNAALRAHLARNSAV